MNKQSIVIIFRLILHLPFLNFYLFDSKYASITRNINQKSINNQQQPSDSIDIDWPLHIKFILLTYLLRNDKSFPAIR